jgi:hypothetical protein
MLISPTDFLDRPYKVPNQEESRDFISFIEEKEEELGRMLLGNELFESFRDALESSAIDDIYIAIRDGENYTYSDNIYQYKGWVDMLRPAIFSQWLPNLTYKLTNIGYVTNDAPQQSSLIDDQYDFQVINWNKFVNKVGYGYTCKNSFYGFMKANEEDYPTWVFTCPRYINRYDL